VTTTGTTDGVSLMGEVATVGGERTADRCRATTMRSANADIATSATITA